MIPNKYYFPHKNTQYLIASIIFIISYFFCMQFAVKINATDHIVYKKLDQLNKSCMYDVRTPIMKTMTLTCGSNYYLTDVDPVITETLENCFTSFYNLSHLFMYMLLGFLCPNLFIETQLIGIGFEMYEYWFLDCADLLDIPYNFTGFIFGRLLFELFI